MAKKKIVRSRTGKPRKSVALASEQSDPQQIPFTPQTLDRTVIAIPLLKRLQAEMEKLKADPSLEREIFPVIIDLNLEYPGGRDLARDWVVRNIEAIIKRAGHHKDPRHSHEAG